MAKKIGGIAGIWTTEAGILKAAKSVREMGFAKVDAITPYPVHGMEEALKIKRSDIPYVTFGMGLLGLVLGTAFTWWTSAVDYPLNIGGKPLFSLPAFVPIMFEITILFAALSSVVALFIKAGLPKVDPPIIHPDLTCHKFALFVPQNDSAYNESKLEQAFKDLGATEVKKMAEY